MTSTATVPTTESECSRPVSLVEWLIYLVHFVAIAPICVVWWFADRKAVALVCGGLLAAFGLVMVGAEIVSSVRRRWKRSMSARS